MNEKLYERMDWAAIEGLVYSDDDHPHDTLGPHVTSDGVLIQAFLPTAYKIDVMTDEGERRPMELADETGFFAVLLPGSDTL